MLIVPDRNDLGDKRLSPEEAIHKERQELLSMASTRKIEGQEELEDAERSSGPRMAWQEVIRRLRICNPSLLFKDGSPGNIAVYRPKTRLEQEESGERDLTKQDWWNDHVYVTGFAKEPLPEYPHVILDTSNLPIREYRGWRSVLIALIKSGAVKYTDATKQFGEPTDRRSSRWHQQLQKFK